MLASASDPSDEDAQGANQNRRFLLAMRALAGLSALLSLLALWSVEGRTLSHDLQLAVETQARPGDRLALRALIFRNVDAPEGATLALAPTQVRLLDSHARELASVALTATPLDTLDGSLQLPRSLAGHFVLEAKAHYEGSNLTCQRPLELALDAPAGRLHGREAGPLQHFSLGSLRDLASAPRPFLPRVVGGACLPETPCRVLVWVGEPAAALTLRAGASVTLSGAPVPSGETSGIVELQVLVHGPDAQLTLEARRAGVLVAERALRLPVGLGEVGLTHTQSLLMPEQLKLRFVGPPGRELITVDTFAEGRWSDLTVLPSSAFSAPYSPPASASYVGLLRMQARADKLSADGSGARVFYLRAPGEDDAHALGQLARQLAQTPELAREPTGAWATQLPSFAASEPQPTAAFMLAALEQQRMSVPLPVSGRPAQLERLAHTRSVFRFGVAGALVLSAVAMALSIARRGILAADQAQSILDSARGESEHEASAPRPGEVFGARLRVLLLALAVAAAFLAAALLIAAKPLWF